MRGLAFASQQMGQIPPGTGGTIGQANREAKAALTTIHELRSMPHNPAMDEPLNDCEADLRQVAVISSMQCGVNEVQGLAWHADRAAWASWRISAMVYGRPA